jgi:integrase
MFALAVRWHWCADNPAKGLTRNAEHRRERFLNASELDALLDALDRLEDNQAAQIFRLLLLTGARRGEVLSMRWQDIDLDAGTWSKPHHLTKQARAHHVCPFESASSSSLLKNSGFG